MARANLPKDIEYHLFFLLPISIRHIDHVQYQVRFNNLFESGPKCRDQLMRKFSNKSNGIRDENRNVIPQLDAADQRIESGKQAAGHESVFLGKSLKQGRFAGIRVTD